MLTLAIGTAIAKAVYKFWTRDESFWVNLGEDVSEMVAAKTKDLISQRSARRQFEVIAEKVAETIEPLFVSYSSTQKPNLELVQSIVAEVIEKTPISSKLIVSCSLEPTTLSRLYIDKVDFPGLRLSEVEEAFVKRIIGESCSLIVDISSELPSFTEATFAEVLRRQNSLQDICQAVLKEVMKIREDTAKDNEDEQAIIYETDYRKTVIRRLDELELFGVDLSNATRRHRLTVAYIALGISDRAESTVVEEANEDDVEDEVFVDHLSLEALLKSEQKILLRGDAGSGKTTALQWIAVKAASRSFEGDLVEWNQLIPFFIRLRACHSHLPAPDEFPAQVSPIGAQGMPSGWIAKILKEGKGIILIDGVDEIAKHKREDVRKWINDLCGLYPSCKVIATSRRNAVDPNWLRSSGFKECETLPLRLQEMDIFIDHWHKAVMEQGDSSYEASFILNHKSQLKTLLRKKSSIQLLATSPLLCAMICAIHFERKAHIPDDRVELYRICCDALIDRRDRERGISMQEGVALSYPQKLTILRDLAFWLLLNGWSSAPIDNAVARVSNKLPGLGIAPIHASGIFRSLIERSCVVREPVSGEFDFAHKTFLEFLGAQEVVQQGNYGFLLEKALDDQWREVLVLSAGLATLKDRTELIKKLIEKGDVAPYAKRHCYILATACLEGSVECDPSVRAEIKKRFSTVVPPKTMTDAKALAAAGELVVPYLSRGNSYATEAAASVRTLVSIGSASALETLRTFNGDKRKTVMNELVRGWDFFDRDDYARLVLNKYIVLSVDGSSTLESIRFLDRLLRLSLHECGVPILTELNELKHLKTLQISKSKGPVLFDSSIHLKEMTRLFLRESRVADWSGLSNSPQLETLNCTLTEGLPDPTYVPRLKTLVYNLLSSDDLSAVSDFQNITTLTLIGVENLRDTSALIKISRLETLSLIGRGRIQFELAELASIQSLRSIRYSVALLDGIPGSIKRSDGSAISVTPTWVQV